MLNMDLDLFAQYSPALDPYSMHGSSSGLFLDAFEHTDRATGTSTANSIATAATAVEETAVATLSGSLLKGPVPTPGTGHADCLCSEMLEVYETVELGLLWAPNPGSMSDQSACMLRASPPPSPTNNDEGLNCQKEVLRSIEKWLGPDASLIQSRHAVLMVSILHKLLASILSTVQALKDEDYGNMPESPMPQGMYPGYTNAYGRDWRCQNRRDTNDPLVAIVEAKGSHKAGGWKIDDEERLHVLRGLLNFRISRLKTLSERLGAIAASNRWQKQASMVQQLLDQLPKQCDLL